MAFLLACFSHSWPFRSVCLKLYGFWFHFSIPSLVPSYFPKGARPSARGVEASSSGAAGRARRRRGALTWVLNSTFILAYAKGNQSGMRLQLFVFLPDALFSTLCLPSSPMITDKNSKVSMLLSNRRCWFSLASLLSQAKSYRTNGAELQSQANNVCNCPLERTRHSELWDPHLSNPTRPSGFRPATGSPEDPGWTAWRSFVAS